jgi:hypothetical protein
MPLNDESQRSGCATLGGIPGVGSGRTGEGCGVRVVLLAGHHTIPERSPALRSEASRCRDSRIERA